MEGYETLRAVAGVLALGAMVVFFIGVCLRALSSKVRRADRDAAMIPLRDAGERRGDPDHHDKDA